MYWEWEGAFLSAIARISTFRVSNFPSTMNRRNLLRIAMAAAVCPARAGDAEKPQLFRAMGIAAPLARAARLKDQGADFLTLGVGDFLVPDQSDDGFAANLAKLKAGPLPVLACNGFIRPADLHCVGPHANHDRIADWAEIVFRRMRRADGTFIVFGSAAARNIPDGWPREKADQQFVSLLAKLGPLAEKHLVTVAVEQLNEAECNYINRIGEAAALVRRAAHPNIRLLADLYHMAVMRDTPADLKAAMDVVAHIEIAEKAARTYPGARGDDFRPYFKVLRESGYQGAISIEGKGDPGSAASAFQEIARQAREA